MSSHSSPHPPRDVAPHLTAPRKVATPPAIRSDVRTIHERMSAALKARLASGLLRTPRARDETSADFSSNDYLGLSRNPNFRAAVATALLREREPLQTGSTGSRLLSGHSLHMATAERAAAKHHAAPAALLFNSGYAANVALFACVPGTCDAVVYDALVHASVHDGIRASRAVYTRAFAHNDVSALRVALQAALAATNGNVIVAVESVYSMDGDIAPLAAFLAVIERVSTRMRDIVLVVDEAHAAGIYGVNGAGLAATPAIANHRALFARVVTLGKAFAAHGAFVLCSDILKQYLFNYARPLIYSTALPPHAIITILTAYRFASSEHAIRARQRLWRLRDRFRERAANMLPDGALMSEGDRSAIQGIVIPGNKRCMAVSDLVRARGFDVYPIRAPTVPKGSERLRVVVHAHNTEEEVDKLVDALKYALVKARPACL